MSHADRDWRVVLLAIFSGACGLLGLAAASSISVYAVIWPPTGRQEIESADRLSLFLFSGALALVGSLLLAASYQAVRVLRGRSGPALGGKAIRTRAAVILLLLWLSASILAQIVLNDEPWKWLAPLLHLLAIGAPIYLFLRIAIGGIRGATRLRLWGSLATGLVLGTGLAVTVEIALFLMAALAAAVYLILNPAQLLNLEGLVVQLGQTSGIEDALTVVEPVLVHPLVLPVVVLAVSGAIPVIEELAKSVAAWAIYDRLRTAADGFWCGAVSGAGFALFEGLVASTGPTDNWSAVLLIRGGSSLMHIVAAAVAGLGIAAFRQSRRAAHLFGGYAAAMGIHAIWNASVVGMGYGGMRSLFSGGKLDVVGMTTASAGAFVLVSMLAVLPVALLLLNRKMRSAPT